MLTIFTIFDHPSDYPEHFVVRESFAEECRVTLGSCKLAETLEEARALIPEGLVNIGRWADDDPNIVESWV